MNSKKILIVAGCAILAAFSLGQGGPPGGGPGGQGGPGFGRGPGGNASPEMLLRRADVQEDLALTDDQKTKIADLFESLRPQRGEGGPGGGGQGGPPPDGGQGGPPPGGEPGGPPGGGPGGQGGPGGGNPDGFRKQMDAMRKKMSEALKKILTPEQITRLKGISIQLNGNSVVMNPEIQKDLALTDAQKTKLKSLQELQGKANRSAFEKMRNGEIDRDELMATMKKNTKALNEEIGKILTDEQKAKLKELAGKPFKANDSEENN